MSTRDAVDQVVDAVLYEGYLLYPYRQSAVKNRVRWTFGGVLPRRYIDENPGSESWRAHTECLLRADPGCRIDVEVRFLQLIRRTAEAGPSWQEAVERRVVACNLDPLALASDARRLAIDLEPSVEELDGARRETAGVHAETTVSTKVLSPGTVRLIVNTANLTEAPPATRRESALMHSLVSCHNVLRAHGGRFVSLTDPPPELAREAAACRNEGAWPVLVGEPGSTDTILASPIILEDYPRIAEESAGNLFDSTEIDELLSLRVLSLTESEKEEVRAGDERGRRVLERTESLTADELMRMHGTIRGLHPSEDRR